MIKGAAAAAAAKLRKEKKADIAKNEKKGVKGVKGSKRDAVKKALKSKIRVSFIKILFNAITFYYESKR